MYDHKEIETKECSEKIIKASANVLLTNTAEVKVKTIDNGRCHRRNAVVVVVAVK